MAGHHLGLVADAKVAIGKVFSDTSVDRATTRESLEEIREEINDRLADLRNTDDDDLDGE